MTESQPSSNLQQPAQVPSVVEQPAQNFEWDIDPDDDSPLVDFSSGFLVEKPGTPSSVSIRQVLAMTGVEHPAVRRSALFLLRVITLTARAALYGPSSIDVLKALFPDVIITAMSGLSASENTVREASLRLLHAIIVSTTDKSGAPVISGDSVVSNVDIALTLRNFSPLPSSPFLPLSWIMFPNVGDNGDLASSDKELDDMTALSELPLRTLRVRFAVVDRMLELMDEFPTLSLEVLSAIALRSARDAEKMVTPRLLDAICPLALSFRPDYEIKLSDEVDDFGRVIISESDKLVRSLHISPSAVPALRLLLVLHSALPAIVSQHRFSGLSLSSRSALDHADAALAAIFTAALEREQPGTEGGMDTAAGEAACLLSQFVILTSGYSPSVQLVCAAARVLSSLTPSWPSLASDVDNKYLWSSIPTRVAASAALASRLILAALTILESAEDSESIRVAMQEVQATDFWPIHKDTLQLAREACETGAPEAALLTARLLLSPLRLPDVIKHFPPASYQVAKLAFSFSLKPHARAGSGSFSERQEILSRELTEISEELCQFGVLSDYYSDVVVPRWAASALTSASLITGLTQPENYVSVANAIPDTVLEPPSTPMAALMIVAAPSLMASLTPLVRIFPSSVLSLIVQALKTAHTTIPEFLGAQPTKIMDQLSSLVSEFPSPAPPFPSLSAAIDALLVSAPYSKHPLAVNGVLYLILALRTLQPSGIENCVPGLFLVFFRLRQMKHQLNDEQQLHFAKEMLKIAGVIDEKELIAYVDRILGGISPSYVDAFLLSSVFAASAKISDQVKANVVKALSMVDSVNGVILPDPRPVYEPLELGAMAASVIRLARSEPPSAICQWLLDCLRLTRARWPDVYDAAVSPAQQSKINNLITYCKFYFTLYSIDGGQPNLSTQSGLAPPLRCRQPYSLSV